MSHVLILLGVVVGLLLVLEVLNAIFDSVVYAVAKDGSQASPAWAIPFVLLRGVLALLVQIGRTTSLVMHECAHALGQFVFGGKPRVVFLKNGGYAQAQPWANAAPAKLVYYLGSNTGLGVICTMPILVGSALLVTTLVATTPMVAHDVIEVGRQLGHSVEARDVLSSTWHVFAAAKWWTYPIMIVVALLLAPGMTPSSVDYRYGSGHLLAYSLGALACAGVAQHHPKLLWALVAGGAVIGFFGSLRGPQFTRQLVGGLGFGTALMAAFLAPQSDPSAALATALGTLAYALAISAIVYVVIAGAFLALSLVSIRPRTLWFALAAAPGNLIDLVRPFKTCKKCNVHYRGKCETCGATGEETDEKS